MDLHRAIGDALSHTMDDWGKYNAWIKQGIDELESNLFPSPLFAKPLTIVHPMEYSLGHSQKFNKITQLLRDIYAFIMKKYKRKSLHYF